MHTLAGRIAKYILRVLLVLILGLLLTGLIKYRGDVGAYVTFLNTRDRNQARGELSITKPASFANMFRGTTTGEALSGDMLTGELLTWSEFTGLDAYDPALEADLNDMSWDSTQSGDFGFKQVEAIPSTDTAVASGSTPDAAKLELLNAIKQREMKK